MRKETKRVLQDIQKNAQMAMSAIDTIQEKIMDKNLSMEMSREYITFADFNNRALEKLNQGKEDGYRSSQVSEVMLKSGIQMNTMLDTSTSHIADMMIQGNTRGMTSICKSMHQQSSADPYSLEMAKELSAFEDQSTERLKKYL